MGLSVADDSRRIEKGGRDWVEGRVTHVFVRRERLR